MKMQKLYLSMMVSALAASALAQAMPSSSAHYATDAYPGFDSEENIIAPSKKEPRWFAFWNGPKKSSASEQYAYCGELVAEESWSKAVKELDALVREWPASKEAAKAQEALATILLERLDDSIAAFEEYRYLIDYYSLYCDYSKMVDKLYEVAGRMRLEGKTIVFFRFRNTVDVRRAFEACVLRAPGAKWAPEAMLTIGELREEEEAYEQAVKVYENLRNLHFGSAEAKQAVAREAEVRKQLLDDYGYNHERVRDTINFYEMALRCCNDADQARIKELLKSARELIEAEAWKAVHFYDSPSRTRRSAINAYEKYLKEYPEGAHIEEARKRLEELKK